MSDYELGKDVIEKIELRIKGISDVIQVALQDLYLKGYEDGYIDGRKINDEIREKINEEEI